MKKQRTKKIKKTARVEIRVTEKEKIALKNKAQSLNMSLSELVLKTALDPTKITILPSINSKLFTELSRQGNNLNQLTRQLNQSALKNQMPRLNQKGIKNRTYAY